MQNRRCEEMHVSGKQENEKDINHTNCNKEDTSTELRVESGDFMKMEKQHKEKENNHESPYEEMSLIKGCRFKLSSYFCRNLTRRKLNNISNSKKSLKNVTFKRVEVEQTAVENACDMASDDEGLYEDIRLGGDNDIHREINNSYEVDKRAKDTQRIRNKGHVGEQVPLFCHAVVTQATIHMQSPTIPMENPNEICNRDIDYAANADDGHLHQKYETPWEDRLPVHVEQYKEVTSQKTN